MKNLPVTEDSHLHSPVYEISKLRLVFPYVLYTSHLSPVVIIP